MQNLNTYYLLFCFFLRQSYVDNIKYEALTPYQARKIISKKKIRIHNLLYLFVFNSQFKILVRHSFTI